MAWWHFRTHIENQMYLKFIRPVKSLVWVYLSVLTARDVITFFVDRIFVTYWVCNYGRLGTLFGRGRYWTLNISRLIARKKPNDDFTFVTSLCFLSKKKEKKKLEGCFLIASTRPISNYTHWTLCSLYNSVWQFELYNTA